MIINGSALLEYAPIKGMINDKMRHSGTQVKRHLLVELPAMVCL